MNRFRKAEYERKRTADALMLKLSMFILVIMLTSWFTHIYASFMAENWLLLIAGAIAFPIGMLHGIGYWFGIF